MSCKVIMPGMFMGTQFLTLVLMQIIAPMCISLPFQFLYTGIQCLDCSSQHSKAVQLVKHRYSSAVLFLPLFCELPVVLIGIIVVMGLMVVMANLVVYAWIFVIICDNKTTIWRQESIPENVVFWRKAFIGLMNCKFGQISRSIRVKKIWGGSARGWKPSVGIMILKEVKWISILNEQKQQNCW